MARYAVEFRRSAEKDLRRLDPVAQRRVLRAAENLATNPRPDGGRKMQGSENAFRVRVGDYRIYFEKHELGVLVHRVLNKNTLKDFLFRSSLPVGGEDEALEQNPKFWELIESAAKK